MIPQCRDVTLTASYLAEEKPGQGAGFLLRIDNHRDTPIAVADPTPLSVHWYALSGGRWLWRASSGAGGSLLNAFAPRGPVFAYHPPATEQAETGTRTIPAHDAYSWTAFTRDHPELRYRPGCEHCTYAGEETFQAVLAYAYMPPRVAGDTPMLGCGLRSTPVVMPPLASAQEPHNSPAK